MVLVDDGNGEAGSCVAGSSVPVGGVAGVSVVGGSEAGVGGVGGCEAGGGASVGIVMAAYEFLMYGMWKRMI